MADDAGALLVRSGLVSANALEDARARVASQGGTLGEQLVTGHAISDDDLTDFYCTRLLVPQVNPNALARLTPKIVAAIPSDMAVELRAIPVSFDADNNLTVAMSDPSDRHAVDEIAFFTGVYVVRAVATQMQIAWCLAHYYGHVTALGQRLLRTSGSESPIQAAVAAASQRVPRTKGLTGKVNASRHRAVAPVTGPVDVIRPNSGELDLRPLAEADAAAGAGATPAKLAPSAPSAGAAGPPRLAPGAAARLGGLGAGPVPSVGAPRPGLPRSSPASTPAPSRPAPTPPGSPSSAGGPFGLSTPTIPGIGGIPIAAGSAPTDAFPGTASSSASARDPLSTSAPNHRSTPAPNPPSPASNHRSTPAPNPPSPASNNLSTAAAMTLAPASGASASAAGPATVPVPTMATSLAAAASLGATFGAVPRAAPDAPTLPPVHDDLPPHDAAGNGEPSSDGAPDKSRARSISGEIRVPIRRAPSIRPPLPEPDDDDEPSITIERGAADDNVPGPRRLPQRRRIVKSDPPELRARAGEVDLKESQDRAIDADEPRIVVDEDALAPPTARIDTRGAPRDTAPPLTTIDVVDDAERGALIHDRVVERESQPILLDRPRATPDQFESARPTILDHQDPLDDDDADTGEIILMLDTRSQKHRPERRTQVGVPPAPIAVRVHHEVEPTGAPSAAPSAIPSPIGQHETDRTADLTEDATKLDLRPAPPDGETTSDLIAAPPSPASDADTNPHIIAPPPDPAPPRPAASLPGAFVDHHDDDDLSGPRTSVMSAAELDDAIPDRTAEVLPGHLSWHRIDYDPIDDGWGPPGTTIPPPLLGAIPGSETEDDDDESSTIPMPSIDSSPLMMVGPPSVPAGGEPAGQTLARAVENATGRAIEVIRELEHAQTRDQVVDVMISHLAETHHRAGFLVTRHAATKGAGELGLFAMTPRPAVMPFGTLRLDRPSTLQDVVGTRLPYRGPMHDDASRSFLVSILGACPPEILLVPVAVRERVVGVLFGEHRRLHTFDDQLALAARAAGMALERILKAKRG